MEVFSRCSDEWIRAGMEAVPIAIPAPSIESAMNITGIEGWECRRLIFDKVKLVSRVISKEMSIKRQEDRANAEHN